MTHVIPHRIAFGGLIFIVSLLSVYGAEPPGKYGYVAHTANHIMDLLSHSTEPDQATLAEATAEGCKTLQILLDDSDFKNSLRKATRRSAERSAERKALRNDLVLFTEQFLHVEESALKKVGLSPVAVKELLWSATFFRNSLDGKPDAENILGAAAKMRDEICEDAKTITQSQAKAESWKTFKKWAYRFGGIVIVVVDVAGTGETATVSDASIPIGASIMGWGQ